MIAIATPNKSLPSPIIDLLNSLDESQGVKSKTLVEQQLKQLSVTRKILEPWVSFGQKCYTRTLLFRNQDLELLLLAWRSGQRSPIHNHAGSVCGMYVVEGVASEINFEQSYSGAWYPSGTKHIKQRDVCSSQDQDVHQIVNLQKADNDLLTLHLYSPPLNTMQLFSLGQSTFADYDDLLIRASNKSAA
jgi:cysteine dioxygenase